MKMYSQRRVNLIIIVRTLGVFLAAITFWYAISGDMAGAVKNGAMLCFYLLGAFLGRGLGRADVADDLDLIYADDEYESSRSSDQPNKSKNGEVITPPAEAISWDGFDPDAPEYPEELDIALQAWRAVSNNPSPRPIKEQIDTWVRENYPHIAKTNESIKRISTIANWSTGGRPRKDVSS